MDGCLSQLLGGLHKGIPWVQILLHDAPARKMGERWNRSASCKQVNVYGSRSLERAASDFC